jgi:hypothetical protein
MAKATKPSIVSPELIERLKRPIDRTWGAICFDAGFVRNNTEALELCIDADRLTTYGVGTAGKKNPAEQADVEGLMTELRALAEQHTWQAVLRAIGKHIKLV